MKTLVGMSDGRRSSRARSWAFGSILSSAFLVSALLGAGCTPNSEESASDTGAESSEDRPAANPERNAYFGDLHVHTRFSFDAFIFNVRATPDDAYRYAKGEAIPHAGGFDVQMNDGPLDFEAVTDHAVYLGVIPAMSDPESELYGMDFAKVVRGETGLPIRERFRHATNSLRDAGLGIDTSDISKDAWRQIIEAAERHNDPGHFTTFVGYEYTSGPDFQNLHRNVIFRGSEAPEVPFSRLDSSNPEDLWAWMDGLRAEGIESLAIPHNSNGSNGQMFRLETFEGEPLDAEYADLRMRNEPLVEITQVKATSETHPLLSPNDEWADFEISPYRVASELLSDINGSYTRQALENGLVMEETQGFNPFRFGFIGSTDTHNGAPTAEESNYHSKVGLIDSTGELRGSLPAGDQVPEGTLMDEANPEYVDTYFDLWSASGLAGVWAEENTRDSIYDAFRRKETFATSGPRMRVRFSPVTTMTRRWRTMSRW